MAKFEAKICENVECRSNYNPIRQHQKYCSRTCKLASFKTTILLRIAQVIKCPSCGTEIDLKLIKENKK